jgi:hypothetical protein
LDPYVRQTAHLHAAKLVVKYLETVHAIQVSSILTALNDVQNDVKAKNATKLRENVWSANMAIMVIFVKKGALETV